MISRMLHKPLEYEKSFFLLGPRGTGKTHWVKAQVPDAIYINLLRQDEYVELLGNPEKLEERIPIDFNNWIIIDEVQKIPALLNVVHRLIEDNSYKFVLTGSSARNLRKKGVNLLAGRARQYYMHPLTASELGGKFDLQHALNLGQLPATYVDPDPEEYLASYVGTYLREEVMQEGLTRNIAAFTRFLEVASFSQGSTLNMAAIAREISVQRKLVEGYFDILEDLLIAFRLPVFNKRAKRKTIQHPKFYFFDVGVYKTIRPMGILDSAPESDGVALETLVLQELRALNDYFRLKLDLYYWRTRSGFEVDVIGYGPKHFFAIEVKRKKTINTSDCKGLEKFHEEYPDAKRLIFYGGNKRLHIKGIEVVPIKEALLNLDNLISA